MIPKYVLDAVCTKHGFDSLFLKHCLTEKTQKDAFDSTLEEIQTYFKGWNVVSSYDYYKKRRSTDKKKATEELGIPDDIVSALASDKGFDDLYMTFYRKERNQKHAFDRTMKYINAFCPDFNRYGNSQSYRLSYRSRRKRHIKQVRRSKVKKVTTEGEE